MSLRPSLELHLRCLITMVALKQLPSTLFSV